MDNLQRQLEEIEALQAVYPDEGLLVLAAAEQEALATAQAAVAAGACKACGSLSGTVRLPDVLLEQQPVSLRFQLPQGYPTVELPQLSVQCAACRPVHEQLTRAVCDAAQAAMGGEALMVVIGALQDAVEAAAKAAAAAAEQEAAAPSGGAGQAAGNVQAGGQGSTRSCPDDLVHVAIWFHHIKSSTKRRHIVDWARELGCCGLCKPGFPGIIVVGGRAADVREYVARLRALQWQAMQVRAEKIQECPACAGSHTAENAPRPALQLGGGRFIELPEQGMSLLGQECTAAGLEGLFLAALKIAK